jgi:thiamine biosynthesis protein ThiC
MTSVEDSIRQWGEFAPALAHMNVEGIKWDWSTSAAKPTVHSVEVATKDRTLVEVFVRGGKFHAEYCEYDKHENFWNVTHTASFMHPHEITDWVNKFR